MPKAPGRRPRWSASPAVRRGPRRRGRQAASAITNSWTPWTIRSVKRQHGRQQLDHRCSSTARSTRLRRSRRRILQKLKRDAESYLGDTVTRFRSSRCPPISTTRSASARSRRPARSPALEVLRIINEPTAAALAYGGWTRRTGRADHPRVRLLGGGTLRRVGARDLRGGSSRSSRPAATPTWAATTGTSGSSTGW